jgi:hypothetical protein
MTQTIVITSNPPPTTETGGGGGGPSAAAPIYATEETALPWISITGQEGETQQVMVDRPDAEDHGWNVERLSDRILLSNEVVTVTIMANSIAELNGIISGEMVSITAESTTLTAETPVGTVQASFEATLTGFAPDSGFQTTISATYTSEISNMFDGAADSEGLKIIAIAYIYEVKKINVTAKGPAAVTLTAPRTWVENNGGVTAVKIIKIADDGTVSILDTIFMGYGDDGKSCIFRAEMDGLSIFGMIAVRAKEEAAPESVGAEKGLGKTALPISGSIVTWIGSNPIVVAIVLIVVTIAGAVGYTQMQARRKIRGVHHLEGEGGGAAAIVDELIEGQRQKALAGIIGVLNDIDGQVRDLERVMGTRAPAYEFPVDEAAPIVDRFFYSCQVAEERIKLADLQGHITKRQVHDLNTQLHGAVQKMVELARQSETLHSLVTEKFAAQAGQ